MTDEKRQYRKGRRAKLEEATRRRITESTIELHGTIGPSATSISAIAENAGVPRSTVYRHFPDERSLFAACSAHWTASNPPPDLTGWAAIHDPDERLRVALDELYAYYRRTERMLSNLFRDEEQVPTVKKLFRGFRDYVDDARDILCAGWPDRGLTGRRLRAATGHAVAFSTWRSLVREQGLEDAEATELVCRMVRATLEVGDRH